ncbi:putative Leu/Ile/Val-binding lipoprotein transmembrane [Parafrankia sp. EAN1pec]|nr:putative Leu/Ile/Val-binding lipoprotein transmembrane [Frankia sp. EAN1pec]
MRQRFLSVLLGMTVVVAAATLGACSGAEGQAAVGGACVGPGVSAGEVRIGLVYSDSGAGHEAFSAARAGVEGRLGLANEAGGVHGRQVRYEWRDDEASPSTNAEVAKDLVRDGSVFGLLMITTSSSGSIDELGSQGVPVVGLADPTWAEHPNMFSHNYGTSPQTVGRYIQAAGGTKVAIVTTGNAAYTMTYAGQYAAGIESAGLATVATIPYSSGGDSQIRIAQQIAASGADALIGLTTPDDFARVMDGVRTARLNLKASVSLAGYDRANLATLGPALAGVSFPVYFRPFEAGGAAIERYQAAMVKFAPEVVLPEQQFSMYAYIDTDLLLRGLELAGPCPTRQGFIEALRKVTDYDAGGLIEPVNLATNPHQLLECNAFVQIDQTGSAFQVTRERLCANSTGS